MARQPDADPVVLGGVVARIFGRDDCRVERTPTGVSTPVYRVRHGGEVFYLRLAETPEASLAPEARVHTLLRERGARVPAVVHFEPFDDALGRSLLVTTAIPGEPVGRRDCDGATRAILRAAGRDLAIVNGVSVAGFGWIRRDQAAAGNPVAEHATWPAWAREYREAARALPASGIFTATETTALLARVERSLPALGGKGARLAHGDFDVTHIYQRDGRYTGVIDFGEIRGAGRLYDLGHFCLHDGETLPVTLLPDLLAGYREVAPLPLDADRRIRRLALLIGVRALARSLGRPPGRYRRWLTGRVRDLLRDRGG